MPPQLTAPPRAPLHGDMPQPPRSMADAARRGRRRRAWPAWTNHLASRLALTGGGVLAALLVWQAYNGGIVEQLRDMGQDVVVETTGQAGFVLGEILVDGRKETDRDALLNTIGLHRGEPIFGIDLEELRNQIEHMPWVASASVERRLPDILHISLTEREPLAIWQNERQMTVIDRAGRPLADAIELARRGNKRIDTLPLVVGPEAPAHSGELLGALDTVPTIAKRVTAAQWIGNRRWNLRLDNGIEIKLPEGDVATALHRLDQIEQHDHLFNRAITSVDLREPDRIALERQPIAPTPEEGPAQNQKKSGKRI